MIFKNSVKILIFWIIFFTIVKSIESDFIKDNITVTIEQGTLFGKISYDVWNGSFYSFKGIPYAKPPIGALRFKAPESPESWSGIYDATLVRTICPQNTFDYQDPATRYLPQSEDCLFLNIHTKMSDKLKPVMVWIHGGGFEVGSIFEIPYGPELLLVEDIVLVKIAYRLNVFGFLSFDNPKYGIHGNAGLKDQVMALKWIQKNIKHFGGDPNLVTIFGESAGGASVHLLYLSPLAKGLFHRAIVQSAAANNPWTTSPNKYPEFAKVLNCNLENLNEIVNCINGTTTDKILSGHKLLSDEVNEKLRTGEIIKLNSITIEEEPNANSFLTQNPENIAKNGEFNKIPIIMGFNTHEGERFINVNPVKPNFTDNRNLIPKDINIDFESDKALRLGQQIKEFYYGNQTPSYELTDPYIDYLTDIVILQKLYKFAKLQLLAAPEVPIYFYQFNYYTKLNSRKNSLKRIVTHFDIVPYLLYFKTRMPKVLDRESEEYIAIHRMTKLWTTFTSSKDANPNPINNDPLLNVKWLPIELNQFNYLKISQTMELKENPAENRMKFWEEIYKRYN